MNYSPSALRLFKAIDEYLKESSKKEYRFTIEEQKMLDRYITFLDNQLTILIDYELKREQEKES